MHRDPPGAPALASRRRPVILALLLVYGASATSVAATRHDSSSLIQHAEAVKAAHRTAIAKLYSALIEKDHHLYATAVAISDEGAGE